jgi:antirestriction protein ArdC
MSDHADIYQRITDQILAMLEDGQGEFELPWRRSGRLFRPTNALTGKPYQGINILALWAAADKAGYTSGQWATYRQWTELGAQVRKGEKASFVLFYKQPTSPGSEESDHLSNADEEGIRRSRRWLAKASCVFAAEQVTGFEPADVPATDPFESSVRAELLIASTGAVIHHGWDQACYIPARDEIRMPDQEAFLGTTTSSPSVSTVSTNGTDLRL